MGNFHHLFSFLLFRLFNFCRFLLFWKNKFFGIFSFLDFCRFWKIYPQYFYFFYFSPSFPSLFRFSLKIIFRANNSFAPAIPPIDFFPLALFYRSPLICAVRRRSGCVRLRCLVYPPYKGSGLLIFSPGLGAGRCLGWGWVLLRFAVFARPARAGVSGSGALAAGCGCLRAGLVQVMPCRVACWWYGLWACVCGCPSWLSIV